MGMNFVVCRKRALQAHQDLTEFHHVKCTHSMPDSCVDLARDLCARDVRGPF